MLVATVPGPYLILGIVALLFALLPFYIGWEIGSPKGRRWFWYVFFLGWIGVLLLALLGPKESKGSSSKPGDFQYHIPPDAAEDPNHHWAYDKR